MSEFMFADSVWRKNIIYDFCGVLDEQMTSWQMASKSYCW